MDNIIQNSSFKSDRMQVMVSNRCESTNYNNNSHMVLLFEALQSLRKDEVFCDVRLRTDDGTIICGHKNIFVSASSYFRAMFTTFEASNEDIVNIRQLDSTTLQLLVDYIYTGKIMISKENVQVLLPAANLFQFDFVKDACVDFLQTQLDPTNCLGIRAFADLYNCMTLLSNSEAYIKKHFLKIVEGDEFLSLSYEEVIKLISSNDLNVPFEEKVFECVINWVSHKLSCRHDSLPKLMEHVRLPLISIEYISKKVVEEPLLKNSPKCKDFVIEALNFHKLKTQQLFTIPQTIRSTPRQCGFQVILVLSFSPRMNKCHTNWYDPATNQWQVAIGLSECHRPNGLAIVKSQFVFALGSYMTNSRTVKMLDLSSHSPCWRPTLDMLVSRYNLGVGVLDNCLYAVGGSDYTGSLNTAEVYDVRTKEWRMIASMFTKRSCVGIGVLNNLIYAVGGYNSLGTLKSVECYDPSTDTWTPVAEMTVCRSGVSIAVLDGVMYAIGGNTGSGCLKSVEAYRPNHCTWTIGSMHLPRYNPEVFALNGLLYVIGGKRGSTSLDSLEIYNPNTNTWTIETLSTSLGQIVGGVVVNRPPYFRTN